MHDLQYTCTDHDHVTDAAETIMEAALEVTADSPESRDVAFDQLESSYVSLLRTPIAGSR